MRRVSEAARRRSARAAVLAAATTAALTVFVALTTSVSAQSTPPNFLGEFEGQFGASSSKLVALAEAIPASSYAWSPGEGVASVGRVYLHIARYNYMYPHENMGRPTPVPPEEYRRWEDSAGQMSKEEVVQILGASMEYVRDVAHVMDASELGTETTLYGRQVGEWAVLLQLVTHMNEHLGQSIAYARMNGVVPPWSG
jgi:uncharacterized damage-inducible protein DinB